MKYFKSLLLLISFALFSSDLLANDGQLISGMSNMSVLIGIVAFMSLFLILAFLTLGVTFNGFLSKNQDSDEEEEPSAFGVWFWSKFNQATPIEKEKDIMLDHNYDGIRELDNQLPAWWKYLFWGSVIMSPIYFILLLGFYTHFN